jgi:transposase
MWDSKTRVPAVTLLTRLFAQAAKEEEMTTETRCLESTAAVETLFMSFELGSTTWKLAFATTRGMRPRLRTITARNLEQLRTEIIRAKERLGVPADAPVRSCYEAGRDGFWLHRALIVAGVHNVVVDPASITVDRRARRAKTDRLDATALVTQLMNAAAGDRRGWHELHVPSEQAEADRHLQREWEAVRDERTRLRNRIQGLLATQGVRLDPTAPFGDQLTAARLWDGRPLPVELVARLTRDWAQLQQVDERLATVKRLRRERVAQDQTDVIATQTRQLAQLRGIGLNGALTLTTELFAWRAFTNGRQVGASIGLTPTPYRSDQHVVEQGIGRHGNRRVRALSIELAWSWLRWQPESELSRWFHARFGQHGRARRIGIVAVARKLIIALWRYVETDTVPKDAALKA